MIHSAFSNEKTAIIAVLAVALAARFSLFAAVAAGNPGGFLDTDSASYIAVAEDIARFGSYSAGGEPEHSRTPGLPFYLALFAPVRDNIPAAVALQIIFSAAACLLVMLFAGHFFPGTRAVPAAGLVCALDVPSIVMANLVMTETLFTFLLILSVFLAVKGSAGAVFSSGAAMGAAILFRPAAAYLPLLILIYLIFKKKKALTALAYVAGCAVLLSPWLARNKVVFGSPFLSTISSKNLLYYRAAGVHSVRNEIKFSESQALLSEKAANEFRGREEDPLSRAEYERKLGTEIILQNPGIYLRNHLMSVIAMMAGPMRSSLDIQLGLASERSTLEIWRKGWLGALSSMRETTSGFTFYAVIFQLIILIAAYALAAAAFFSIKRRKLLLPACVILYFLLVSGGPEAYARFRTPVVPFIAVMAGAGADLTGKKIKTLRA